MSIAQDPRSVDRRVSRTLRFPERRSGFDRRRPVGSNWREAYEAGLRSYRDSSTKFLLVVATIVVFNYIDYMLTIRVLRAGGVELNPLMAHLLDISPTLAAVAKLGSVGVVALVLLMLRRYRRTLEASLVLLVAFTVLMFYHGAVAIQLLR
jgi:hypothetical protein